ncbi:tetratricopeptide repeat protein [Haliangium sp.]|uniref:tetratricopeptide repeat protein n=1 Tax=Haliangium sp. TaxID=2663208 RepID=UPI003D0BE4FB
MRAVEILFMSLLLPLVAACPNQQLHLSIEQMNSGIQAFETGSFATAQQHFEQAAHIYPDNHAAWYYLGFSYERMRDWEKAAESFAEAVKLKKDEPMYQMWHGIALYESGKYSLAESYLEKAIELEPSLYRGYWFLGSIYEHSDRPEEAAQMWTRAAQLNPEWGRPFVSLGVLYLRWDMLSEAYEVLEQGTQHVRGEELPDVYYYLGLTYDAQKNWDKAVDAYTQSIEKSKAINRDNVEAKFQRGLVYLRQGDKENAKPDLETASRASPDPFTKQEANKALMELVPTEPEEG